ncbi:thiol:disulfide interchange protein DsbA/DsbL [Undibacterium fentianense]|uniref:Thiol:disulfide interchange protein DsbA n=1 Tax=Undibacterium fentianense TaxID=2828728 RepID=A0A941IG84_9BURK|nr:thiol:disulfide interchange protein DsbA/DsbL [Undibacterium fentianense]MBR7801122.1 thiol:disulfide interchange protein DsbA/DsbL [Undibacterium fentianense]
MQISKRRFTQMLAGTSFGVLTNSVFASVAAPELGVEYKLLRQPQALSGDIGKKIEVIEFFAYYCPHCYALEPVLADWVKKQGDKIAFKRIHVLNPGVESQQKLFFALDAMGKAEELHLKVFEAYHVKRNRLLTDDQVRAFIDTTTIDKTAFNNAYKSFSVLTKQGRSSRVMADYEIESWPTLVLDGRLQTSPSMAARGMGRVTEQQQNEAVLPILDFLVNKAQKEKASKA